MNQAISASNRADVFVLGEFEFTLIRTVMLLGELAYGAEIHRAVCERLKRDVAIAQVFNTLDRLRQKGVLVSHPVPPPSGKRGPHRNVYTLTKLGEESFASAADAVGRGSRRHGSASGRTPMKT